MKRIFFKYFKYIFPFTASVVSAVMFFSVDRLEMIFPKVEHIKDDFFTIAIFSAIVLFGSIIEEGIKLKNYYFITMLCSFWMLISYVFHFLTTNEWTISFVIVSLMNIASFALLFCVYARTFYHRGRIYKQPTLYLATINCLAISGLACFYVDLYLLGFCSGLSVLLAIFEGIQNEVRLIKEREMKTYVDEK